LISRSVGHSQSRQRDRSIKVVAELKAELQLVAVLHRTAGTGFDELIEGPGRRGRPGSGDLANDGRGRRRARSCCVLTREISQPDSPRECRDEQAYQHSRLPGQIDHTRRSMNEDVIGTRPGAAMPVLDEAGFGLVRH
jgi:hypothetical protein